MNVPLVVSRMGILTRYDHNCNATLNKVKIPDYAKDYKNEYLFIRRINKTCGDFVKNLDDKEIFKSSKVDKLMLYINRFLKAQQLGYLIDTSEIYFKENDVGFIESLELQLDDYRDLYCDEYSYQFDEEKYNNNIENDYPGFKKFFECFSKFQGKLYVDYLSESDYDKLKIYDSDSDDSGIDSDSDSDSDESGIDSDDIEAMFGSDDESEFQID